MIITIKNLKFMNYSQSINFPTYGINNRIHCRITVTKPSNKHFNMWIYIAIRTKLNNNIHSKKITVILNLKFETYIKNGAQQTVKHPKIIPRTLTPLLSFAAEMAFGFFCKLFRYILSFLKNNYQNLKIELIL